MENKNRQAVLYISWKGECTGYVSDVAEYRAMLQGLVFIFQVTGNSDLQPH